MRRLAARDSAGITLETARWLVDQGVHIGEVWGDDESAAGDGGGDGDAAGGNLLRAGGFGAVGFVWQWKWAAR